MKKLLIFSVVTLLLMGCKKYVQLMVIETVNSNVIIEDGFYVFENDTLKIEYNFWKNHGVMRYTIFNKLNKPLYVDWKKSSFIDNSNKLDYWRDETIGESMQYYAEYYYNSTYSKGTTDGVSSSSFSSVKRERITFIPPSSNFDVSQFYIYPESHYVFTSYKKRSDVPRNDNPKKKTTVYMKVMDVDDTFLIFRNFMTFSFTEDFENEFYVDNGFFVKIASEMDTRHFDKSKFKRGTSFYIIVPEYEQIKD